MLKPEHISAYSLIIEEGTPFWNRFGKAPVPVIIRDLRFQTRIRKIRSTVLPESSCRSRALSGTRSQIMQNREKNAAIISVTGLRWHIWDWDLGHPPIWKAVVLPMKRTWISIWHWILVKKIRKSGETALRKLWGQIEELSQAQRMEEFMFLGLRMLKGVSDVDFVRLFGVKMETVYGDVIRRLTANGLLKKEENNLALTEWGMDVSNFVLSEFLLG